MNDYFVSEIRRGDAARIARWERLLAAEGISRDPHLDYTVGMFDGDDNIIATGSCFSNTLRCLAVAGEHQGEGLLATVVTHLLTHLASKGIIHAFLYTKRGNVHFFRDLGFTEIGSGGDDVALMENRRDGFRSYLAGLAASKRPGDSAAVVMNCNPFTLGHRHLVETAARGSDFLHVFVVSEDVSLFPYADRRLLISKGVEDITNVALHEAGSYIISSAVFPSYFIADGDGAIMAQARLDVDIFKRIAGALGVRKRYAGTEPFSRVTGIYNAVMREELPAAGIEFIEIPRAEINGAPISASRVRELIKTGDLASVRELVPPGTYEYLLSGAGRETVKKIMAADSVTHY